MPDPLRKTLYIREADYEDREVLFSSLAQVGIGGTELAINLTDWIDLGEPKKILVEVSLHDG